MPPPMTSMMSRSVVPMSTSIRPVLTMVPASAKTLVPLERSVPMPANQSPPSRMMGAMLA
jgi:hypothetical protein